jgi:dipeptidyl aminopeptidase/acylaminoacyl peptidase
VRISVTISIFFTLLVSGCSSASFFVSNIPTHFSDIQHHSDISYGAESWQKLDVYSPKIMNEKKPVLVFFYGGRWTFGNKEQYAFAALPFVKEGYIVVIPDYSKYPDVKFPSFVNDAALAVSWVHDNIRQYNGNPKRLYLSGHSSGAHIAALVTTNPDYMKQLGKDRNVVTAFSGLAGPYDFIPEDIQVPTYVDGQQPPMQLLHGADDTDVIQRNLNRLREKIKEKGGVVETKIYTGIDHKEIVGALTWVWQDKAPVRDDMLDFFERHQ